MCDEDTVRDDEEFLRRSGQLTRRRFGKLSAGAGLAMILPPVANAVEITGADVEVTTPDGTADCYFTHPTAGSHPGILMWPDIFGLRTAFRTMARRLAESGYSVLVVNPYYRSERAPVVPEGASFQDENIRNKLFPMARAFTAATNMSDAKAFTAWLDAQPSVDKNRKMGTMGYCMGGPFVMRTVAAVPARMGAGATFHGGNMVTDAEDSPHLTIPKTTAHMLHAIAANDDERTPDVKNVLRSAYDKAGIPAEIKVYEGTLHGWCVVDSAVYNEGPAEQAWSRTLALFESALG